MRITYKRAKILATVGPAVNSYEKLEEMIRAGVNGFRFNFSHGNNEERDQQIAWLRQAAEKVGKPVAVLQDLQGPKIRLGILKDNMTLSVESGDILELVYGQEHDGAFKIPVQYDLSTRVKPGEVIYIFDGKVKTTVKSVENGVVKVEVFNSGELMSRKGLNLPDTDFTGNVLTEKDYADIDYGTKQDIDYVALSFVHQASDIEDLRKYMLKKGSTAKIVAKIETRTAMTPETLEEIVKVSDAVMVARGDLASEIGAEVVPFAQRQIIELCQKHAKISIVATQVLGSMVESPQPTRAEVSDIANAVIQGADCVMLSDETANGKYPLEAIKVMKDTILYTQEHVKIQPLASPESLKGIPAVISKAAVRVSKEVNAEAIVAETKSGATAMYIAAHRPSRPIISVTSDKRVAQQLCLLYANKSFLREDGEKAGLRLAQELVKKDMLEDHAVVTLVSGKQPGVVGETDTIKIRII